MKTVFEESCFGKIGWNVSKQIYLALHEPMVYEKLKAQYMESKKAEDQEAKKLSDKAAFTTFRNLGVVVYES